MAGMIVADRVEDKDGFRLSSGAVSQQVTLNLTLKEHRVWVRATLASKQDLVLIDREVPAKPFRRFWDNERDIRRQLVQDEKARLEHGTALVEALFGDARAQSELMPRIDDNLAKDQCSVLSLPIDLWIESYDDDLLMIPWRTLAWHGHLLERYGWSMSVARLGLLRPPQVDLPRPSDILLIMAENDELQTERHAEKLEAKLIEAEPSLTEGYIRRVQRLDDLEPVLKATRPCLVYFYGHGSGGSRPRLYIGETKIGLDAFVRYLRSGVESLRVVYVNACMTDGDGLLSGGRILSPMCPYVFVNPTCVDAERGRNLAVHILPKIVSGVPPQVALKDASNHHTDVDPVNPKLWRRPRNLLSSPAPEEGRLPFPLLTSWLNRDRQRRDVFARIDDLVFRGRPATARGLAFVFVGEPEDHPELFGGGLCEDQQSRFSNRIDFVPLPVQGMPQEDPFKAKAALLAKLRAGLGARSDAELRQRFEDHIIPGRAKETVFWLHWGAYPPDGRPYRSRELARWFGGIKDNVLTHLPPSTHLVSTIGYGVKPTAHEDGLQELTKVFREKKAHRGSYPIVVLDPLGPVTEVDVENLLSNHARSFKSTDSHTLEQCVEAMFTQNGKMVASLSYRDAIQKLKRIYDDGPNELIYED